MLFMIYNQLSEYLLKHLAQVQTLMMMSAGSEDAGFRSITRKSQIYISLLGNWKPKAIDNGVVAITMHFSLLCEWTNVGQHCVKSVCG